MPCSVSVFLAVYFSYILKKKSGTLRVNKLSCEQIQQIYKNLAGARLFFDRFRNIDSLKGF